MGGGELHHHPHFFVVDASRAAATTLNRDRIELEVVTACHRALDRHWSELEAVNDASPEPAQVVCKSGCAACCTQLPDASTAEGALLAWRIQWSSPADRAEALERLFAWEWEFGMFVHEHPITMPHDDWRGHLLWRAQWQLRRVACPFLNGDNTCGVYADRPATCRAHHVCMPPVAGPKLPPESCFADPVQTAAGELRSQWTLNPDLSEAYSGVVKRELEDNGFEYKSFVLIPVVLLEGRRRYGWPPPATTPPTRSVRHLSSPFAP